MSNTDKAAEALRLADAMGGYSSWDDKVAAMLREYAALLQAQQAEAGRVPPGWKLVPVEPTQEMLDALGGHPWLAATKGAYEAMLAAAPQPPKEQP